MPSHRRSGLLPDEDDADDLLSRENHEAEEVLSSPMRTSVLDVLQGATSLLLRLAVYIFLRWIPTSLFIYPLPLVPIFFGTYLLCWLATSRKVGNFHAALKVKESGENVQAQEPSEEGERWTEVHTESVSVSAPNGDDGVSSVEASERSKSVLASRRQTRKLGRTSIFQCIKGLIFGTSTLSRSLNKLSLLFNLTLFAFFLDSLLSPYIFPSHWEYNLHFFRTGAVGPNEAKVHIRYPYPFGWEAYEKGSAPAATRGYEVDGSSLPIYEEIDPALIYNPEPLRVIYREIVPISASPSSSIVLKETSRWERGPLLHLTPDSDWTTTVTLSDLWPSTEYEWTVAFTHNHTRPHHERVQRFTTFPDPRLSKAAPARTSQLLGSVLPRSNEEDANPLDDPNHFTFAVSSCVKPDFPWHPLQFGLWSWIAEIFRPDVARRNQIKGFDLMAERTIDSRRRATSTFVAAHPSIRFFLQLGDLIYADVPFWQGWLGDGPKVEHYRKLYRNLFASESFRRLYERVPVIGIYDDHEAKNNWSGGSKDAAIQAAIPPATQAWQEYVGLANPANSVPEGKGEHWYTFRHGDSAFFVLDVRKHRAAPEMVDDEDKQVLGEVQKEALYSWLSAVNTSSTTFKFIVSSVPFNSMWGGVIDLDGQKDSWAGYLTERDELLETLHYVPNVIVLSGDRHEFAAAALSRKKSEEEEASEGYTRWPVTEFSTSPLNMFYLPIRTLSQEHGRGATGQEKLLKYLPDGNVKWTEIEVDTRDALQPLLRATVMIDGKEAWKVDIVGQPVVSAPAQAVGGLAKTLLEWLGFKSKTWF